jgi:thiamine-monophosphate kinase
MLGQKSVAVNLSDIAAMGGKPLALFCAVAVPREKKFILRPLAQGIRKACEAYRVDFLGGDTNQAQEHLTICHTVLGEVPAGKYLRRQGAKKDDLIFCTGTIGDHGLGLEILKHPQEFPQLSPAERERLVHGFLSPTPRVEMGQHLQKIDGITSVIDISDGLLQDLGHILSASQVSAVLDPNRIPLSAPFRKSGLDVRTACTVGEDYELLFTARPAKQREVTALSSSSLAISCLGQIIACEGSVPGILDPDKKPWKVDTGGYRHF